MDGSIPSTDADSSAQTFCLVYKGEYEMAKFSINEITEAVRDAVCEIEAVADEGEYVTYSYALHFDDAAIVKAILTTPHDGASDWFEERLWEAIGNDVGHDFGFIEIMSIIPSGKCVKGNADCWMEE